jgi:hypothetical protein
MVQINIYLTKFMIIRQKKTVVKYGTYGNITLDFQLYENRTSL